MFPWCRPHCILLGKVKNRRRHLIFLVECFRGTAPTVFCWEGYSPRRKSVQFGKSQCNTILRPTKLSPCNKKKVHAIVFFTHRAATKITLRKQRSTVHSHNKCSRLYVTFIRNQVKINRKSNRKNHAFPIRPQRERSRRVCLQLNQKTSAKACIPHTTATHLLVFR